MKIRAIRVRDVGHFSAPAALEGLSGGLDVLAAGNEAGKSTLFRALEVAFFEKHTGKGGRIQAITPKTGGSPLIEVDFGVNGDAWRIAKQFGSGKRAVLTQIGGGGREVRGDEAEDGLAQLVGLPGGKKGFLPGRLGLLWVGQGGALQPLPPDVKRGEAEALQQIIEREVSTLTGGSLVRRLRANVADELGSLKTPSRTGPRVKGPWDEAVKREAEIARALELAVAAKAESARRREALAVFKSRRAELTAAERVLAGSEAIAAAVKARDEAVAARRLLRDVQLRVTAQEGALKEAKHLAAAMQDRLSEFATLGDAIRAAEPRLAAAGHELAERRAAVLAVEAHGEALRTDERRAQAAVHAADQSAMAAQARMRLAAQEKALAAAQGLEAEIAEGAAALAGKAVDGALLDRLILADAAFKRASDALAAGAPTVTIAYEPGAAPTILCDGKPVRDGVLAVSAGPMRLVIPGVGAIEIAAAASGARDAHIKTRDEALGVLERGLAALGVAVLDEARARHKEVAARLASLEALRARLSGLAPGGVQALFDEVEAARDSLTDAPQVIEGQDRASLTAALDALRVALGELRGTYRARQAEIEPLVAAVGREQDLITRSKARLVELERELCPAELRESEMARLKGEADSLRQAANGALRELAAVRETVPDEAEIATLEVRVRTLQAEQASVAKELHDIEVGSARLEGEEANADALGLAGKVAELEGELVRARADVARFEAEVASLSLLVETIDAAEADNRERFFAPVVKHLNPYLDMVFAGARLRLGGDFAVNGLERTGVLDDVDVLSGGTQEQIAVLVRLAFAGLLAGTGHAAPLILDDALVYSDDDRLKRIFDALAAGAKSHQVVVLTCHKNAFDALGGQRVALEPWRCDQ
jgi:hypothetical protein